jgi:UDP:flavonoid glycosyltransferase YjiC (YdhE family)
MANIILTTIGTAGDVFPFIRIGSVLSKRGHDVTLISNHRYQVQAEKAGLTFAAVDSARESEQLMAKGELSNSPQGFLTLYREYYLPKVPAEFRLLEKLFRPNETLLVTRSTPAIAALCAAEAWQLPVVSVYLAPSFISSASIFEELVGSVLLPEINEIRSQLRLAAIQNWHSSLKSSCMHLALWPEWFAGVVPDWAGRVHFTGFPLPPRETNDEVLPPKVQKLLAAPGRSVLITGGTANFTRRESLIACIQACRKFGLRGIVVTPHSKELTDFLGDDFVWIEQVPFELILDRVTLIIHHGGIGTMGQALAGGAPQLVIGEGADRPDNAACLRQLGTGEYLPPAQHDSNSITQCLQRLTASDIRKRCADIAAKLKNEDGIAQACDILEELFARKGWSSANLSPPPPIIRENQKQPRTNTVDLKSMIEKLSPTQRASLERRFGSKALPEKTSRGGSAAASMEKT